MHPPAYAKAASAGGPAYAETASAGRPDRVYRHTTSIKDKARASAPAYIFKTCFLNFVLSLFLCACFTSAQPKLLNSSALICEIRLRQGYVGPPIHRGRQVCGRHRTKDDPALFPHSERDTFFVKS